MRGEVYQIEEKGENRKFSGGEEVEAGERKRKKSKKRGRRAFRKRK